MRKEPIIKELKYGTWVYDPDQREFLLYAREKETGQIKSLSLNKVYAFSFVRFVLRVAQKYFRIRRS